MVTRPHETHEIDGVSFRFEALPFDKATDILPEVFQVVSRTLEAGIAAVVPLLKSGKLRIIATDPLTGKAKLDGDGLAKLIPLLAPTLVAISNEIGAPRNGTSMLKFLEPKLFAESSATFTNERGEKERVDLIDGKDRARVFDAHPSTYLLALFLAGKLTFARYFPVAAAEADGSNSSAAAASRASGSP